MDSKSVSVVGSTPITPSMKKLSKEEMDFLNENPTGKIEDLPEVLKGIIGSTVKKVEEIIDEDNEVQQKRNKRG